MKALMACAVVGFWTAVMHAHHSPLDFDRSRRFMLHGTVAAVEWENPHVSIPVEVEHDAGSRAVWVIEAQSPRVMSLFGWSPTSLVRGDRVVVAAHPSRREHDTRVLGLAVTRPDGRELRIVWGRSRWTGRCVLVCGLCVALGCSRPADHPRAEDGPQTGRIKTLTFDATRDGRNDAVGYRGHVSARSASAGSTASARRVGTMHASRHTPIMITA